MSIKSNQIKSKSSFLPILRPHLPLPYHLSFLNHIFFPPSPELRKSPPSFLYLLPPAIFFRFFPPTSFSFLSLSITSLPQSPNLLSSLLSYAPNLSPLFHIFSLLLSYHLSSLFHIIFPLSAISSFLSLATIYLLPSLSLNLGNLQPRPSSAAESDGL